MKQVPFDYVGLLLMVVWVAALQVVADKGRELDWFSSDLILWLSVLAAVAFAYFIAWETTEPHPVVDLSLFRSRNFCIAVGLFGFSYAALFGGTVIQPLWMLQYHGYTATNAAWLMTMTGLVGFVMMPLVERLVDRTDPRKLATVAFILIFVSFHLRAGFNSSADVFTIAMPMVVLGIALSIYTIPMFMIAYDGVSPERLPSASGIMNFIRYFLAALAASLLTTLWDRRQGLHHSQLAESISMSGNGLETWRQLLEPLGLSPGQTATLIERVVNVEAAVMGANDVFWMSALLILAGTGLLWLTRPVARAR